MMLADKLQNKPLHIFGTPPPDRQFTERVAVYAIIREKDNIATVRTPNGYFLPGGGIEYTESIHETLVREIFEELGWAINIHETLPIVHEYLYSHAKQKYYLIIAHFFNATFCAELCEPYDQDHQLVWLPQVDSVVKLSTESMKWAVQQK